MKNRTRRRTRKNAINDKGREGRKIQMDGDFKKSRKKKIEG